MKALWARSQASNLRENKSQLKWPPFAFNLPLMKSGTFPSLVWLHDTTVMYGARLGDQRAVAWVELWDMWPRPELHRPRYERETLWHAQGQVVNPFYLERTRNM